MTSHTPRSADPRYRAPSPPRDIDPFDGVLLVDKPSGPTSHDIVAAIRRRFNVRKVGHGGTLDPQATGLLIVLLGRGTKLSSYFMSGDKAYDGVMRLGVETDSQDADGQVVREADYTAVTQDGLQAAMERYRGDMMQTPPMVSAVKVDGVPLYKRARKGQTIEREPRLIHVYRFEMTRFAPPDVAFRVLCTKGTYVRTLCADIGRDIGCGAHLAALRRTESGNRHLKDAVAFDTIMHMEPGELTQALLPLAGFVNGAGHGNRR